MGTWYVHGYDSRKAVNRPGRVDPVYRLSSKAACWYVEGYSSGSRSKATGWICHVDPVHRPNGVGQVPALANKTIWYQGHIA